MTKHNKRLARFGDRYGETYLPIWFKIRRFANAVRDADMRRACERWTFVPHIANMAAPTLAELEAATPIRVSLLIGESLDGQILGPPYDTRYTRSSGPITWTTSPTVTWGGPTASGDILDRIDDTLLTYDSQRATGERPWPYREF